MRICLVFVQIFVFSSILLAQETPEFLMPLWFEDAVGNKDTIWVGEDSAANCNQELDAEYGEELIISPFDHIFEVRAVNVDGASPWGGGYKFSKQIISCVEPSAQCHLFGGIGIFIHAQFWPVKVTWDSLLLHSNPFPCNYNTILTPNRSVWTIQNWYEAENIYCMSPVSHLSLDYNYPNLSPIIQLWTEYEISGSGVDTIWGYWLTSHIDAPHCLTTLPIEEALSISEIQLYPNPAGNWLQIEVEDSLEITDYEIYDVNGKMVQMGTYDSRLVLVSLQRGVYVLLLKDKFNKFFSKSFVKM